MYDCYDYHNMRGVSLFSGVGSGLKCNHGLPVEECGELVENLARTYYFSYSGETKKKFSYFSKLKGEHRRNYKKEKRERERSRGW